MQTIYGFPHGPAAKFPDDIDFYILSNEDIAFTANLVTTTNEIHAFAMPYPSSIDLFDETIVLWAIEFKIMQKTSTSGAPAQLLEAFLSYLDKEFGATFLGNLADAEDENMKAQFADGIVFGQRTLLPAATVNISTSSNELDSSITALYYPPVPLDLLTPLFIQLMNRTISITLATGATVYGNFTSYEKVSIKPWFTIRKLTASEKRARAVGIRFMQLDS